MPIFSNPLNIDFQSLPIFLSLLNGYDQKKSYASGIITYHSNQIWFNFDTGENPSPWMNEALLERVNTEFTQNIPQGICKGVLCSELKERDLRNLKVNKLAVLLNLSAVETLTSGKIKVEEASWATFVPKIAALCKRFFPQLKENQLSFTIKLGSNRFYDAKEQFKCPFNNELRVQEIHG